MGEQFIGTLTNAFRTVTVSRKRALQIIGGAIAIAAPSRVPQAAEAGKHRKPPLVFVGATLTAVSKGTNADEFAWFYVGRLYHPDSGTTFNVDGSLELVAKTSTGDVRTRLVTQLKSQAANELAGVDHDVPTDRIAVTLL